MVIDSVKGEDVMIIVVGVFLFLNLIVIGLIGVVYFYDLNLLLMNYGLLVSDLGLDNMVCSFYGGLFFVFVGFFVFGVVKSMCRVDVLILVSLFMGGLVVGCVVSFVLVGVLDLFIYVLFVYEVVVCVIVLFFFCSVMSV